MIDKLKSIVNRFNLRDDVYSSAVPKIVSWCAIIATFFSLFMAIRIGIARAQVVDPSEETSDFIDRFGFETWVAWIMLVFVLGILGFIMRRFGSLLDSEREDRKELQKGYAEKLGAIGETLLLLNQQIIEDRRDSTHQHSRVEEKIVDSRDYYERTLQELNRQQDDTNRRLEALQSIAEKGEGFMRTAAERIEDIQATVRKLDPDYKSKAAEVIS